MYDEQLTETVRHVIQYSHGSLASIHGYIQYAMRCDVTCALIERILDRSGLRSALARRSSNDAQ